jgi:ATP-dependent Clp protease ATP-binding subunit ClpC
MKFKFHLFVQKHQNRTYTVTVMPFWDLTAYGINLDEIKSELAEALVDRVRDLPPQHLQNLEFESKTTIHKVQVSLRPIDKRKHKKRRELVKLMFSLIVRPDEDGQLIVTVPKIGSPPLTFYAYSLEELDTQATHEITTWFDSSPLEQLMEYRHARAETLEVMEVDVPLRKPKEKHDSPSAAPEQNFWALREVGVNMTAQASEGRFRKAYRRDRQVEDVMRTLLGSRNNSVLITGASEVGKTAVMHEVIRRIHRKECDEKLHNRQVWMLTPDRLIAGAQFIGTWEERINDIANECRQKQHILYVEDLPGLLEVGRWSKSDSNVAMALKPHIASGEVIIMGESSPERLTMGMHLGASFLNLFRVINVDAMVEEETLSVLGNVARDLEREFDLRIDPGSLDTSIALSRRFLPYRSFPGKAIRLLEESVADASKNRPVPPEPSYPSLLRRIGPHFTVDRQHILGTFSRQTGLPEFVVNDAARLNLNDVESYFRERIIGQDQAIGGMVNLIATVKAGLNDPNKPLGTFLFIGPTGVGKTEMAKTLASYLFGDPSRLIRFDMSEYGSMDGVARLIGAFSNEGELTRRVREQPFCVVLLDEFEKADPRIYDIFLQVLGEGRLTDSRGKTTSFQNAIIIMTSNLGSGQREFRSLGFGTEAEPDTTMQSMAAHYQGRIESYFRPEFINRIDQIVVFGQLSRTALRQIASRELSLILGRDGITRRNVLVEIDDAVIDLVLEHGYSPVYGARPLKREIERIVVAPLARALAGRGTKEQNLMRVVVENGKVTIKAVPITDAEQSVRVELATDGGSTTRRHMDTPAIVEGLAMLRRKLADWDNAEMIKEMRKERAHLLAETQRVDFWSNPADARDTLTRFHYIDRLVNRLSDLLERSEYLEDFGVMVNRERAVQYQSDLARDYEDLHNQISYLDIELMTAHLPHRNQSLMLVSPYGGANDDWMRRLAETYLRWSERKGYEIDLFVQHPQAAFARVQAGTFEDLITRFTALPDLAEIAVYLQGTNVFGFLKGERGLHKLAGRDSASDEFAQVRVYAIPDNTSITDWLREYHSIKTEIAEGKRAEPTQLPPSVIRTYSLERTEKFIRDMRTGIRTGNIKDVMGKGMLDEFILAYLRTDEPQMAWEDRFPPTFPY